MALRLVVFAVLALLLSGCRARTAVDVVVNEDGSGLVVVEVELDPQAAAGVLDLEGEIGLWLTDVNEAGWKTVPPTVGDDGFTRVGASKEFGTPEQFTEIMNELSGDAQLFSNFRLIRKKEFARVRYEVRGTLNPSGIEAFGDADLVSSLGRSLESLVAEYGGSPTDFDVEVRVHLPGHIDETVEPTGAVYLQGDGPARVWQTDLSKAADEMVVVGSTTTGVAALAWRGIAVVAAVLALLVALGHLLRVLRPSGRRARSNVSAKRPSARGPINPEDLKAEDEESDGDEDETGSAKEEGPRVVALDAMGVLYREPSDIAEILIPFAREMGSTVNDEAISAKARAMSLGRLAPVDLWKALGIEGDANELDDLYLARHHLNPGVVNFLRDLRDRGVRVACVTNDSSIWANKLSTRHSLEGLIDPWVVSGAVGVRKPDAPIYEVLRRVTGEPASLILVIDDELANLDAARDLGFRTAWYAPAGEEAGARGHAILRSFSLDDHEPEPAS